ncbi:hypothetical protein E8E14_013107 [Neopestalotiopsis sp. 37M]|nr:hypothetical protein E8E14_013107 [Neopestalotiopsis sp. 37M]
MPARFPFKSTTPASQATKPLEVCELLTANAQRQVWAVGNRFVIKIKPYHPGCKVEVDNVTMVQTHTNMPAPAVVRSWRDGDRFFTLQKRVQGETLEAALPKLTEEDLTRIGEDLSQHLSRMRRIQNPRMEMINGTGVVDWRLLKPVPEVRADRYSVETDGQLAGLLAHRIRGHIDDEILEEFMSEMPSGHPYTFSHSDLHEGNIMVKDGKFSGLIDWDLSGYYPVWWESVNATTLLDPYLSPGLACPDALQWFDVYQAIRDAPGEADTLAKLGDYLFRAPTLLHLSAKRTSYRPFHSTLFKMAVPPKFAGQKLQFAKPQTPATSGVAATTHTLEVYLDYVCPFSAKLFNTLYNTVVPLIRESGEWSQGLEIVFRQQVQPWHPSSTLVHEAAVAVLQLQPEKFWQFSDALFKQQKDYFDVNVVNETRNNTYKRLAKLAGSVGVDEAAVFERLQISDKPGEDGSLNSGNKVTNDFKVLVKMARLVGVHVSPTAIFDGVVANDISSGWGKQEWADWLTKNVVSQVCRRLASTSPKAAAAPSAKDAAAPAAKYKYPETLQLFHAGVSRITFLACVKLSTILLSAFFLFVVTPGYHAKEGWSATTIRKAAFSGAVPLLFVGWTTSPFVLMITTKLPPFARTSEQYLKRYLANLPADTVFGVTTMSPIAKPRTSKILLSELRQTKRRMGIVNYVRDAAAENATRKWYNYRAVDKFSIQTNNTKGQQWTWDTIAKQIPQDKH